MSDLNVQPLCWKLNTVVQEVYRRVVGVHYPVDNTNSTIDNRGRLYLAPVEKRIIEVFDSVGIAEEYSALVLKASREEGCRYNQRKQFAKIADWILIKHNYDKDIAIVLFILSALIIDLPAVDRDSCGPVMNVRRWLELKLEKGE